MTRWKPSVGWVSISSGARDRGGVPAMKSPSAFLSSSMLAAQARSTSAAVGLSRQREQQVLDGDELCRFWRALRTPCGGWTSEFLRDHLSFPVLIGSTRGLRALAFTFPP